MPPLPKPPGERVRRGGGQADWQTIRVDPDRPVPHWPDFAPTPLPEALAYWNAVWCSPMAAMYDTTDELTIARAAMLHASSMTADMMRGRAPDALSELRQLEDRLGLSPKARRQLQWEIDKAAGAGVALAAVHPIDEHRQARDDRRDQLSGG
jgi:hypothetical protein